jgi:hypothetical protein
MKPQIPSAGLRGYDIQEFPAPSMLANRFGVHLFPEIEDRFVVTISRNFVNRIHIHHFRKLLITKSLPGRHKKNRRIRVE